MKYLLDTDHISLLEHRSGPAYAAFALRLNLHATDGIVVSVVSFQEQVLGAHDRIATAKKPEQLLRGYALLLGVIEHYRLFPVLPFEQPPLDRFDALKRQKIRIGTMDLRIAAIALANDLTLVTANTSDFAQVPGLRLEDWTR
jgi:tRNA(fMet)-specific endonuclease VapC